MDVSHMVVDITSSRQVIILGKENMLLESTEQLILDIEDIETVKTRVLEFGGKIVEECVIRGKIIIVVEGPENIQLILLGGDGCDIASSEALLAWQVEKSRARRVFQDENSTPATSDWNPPSGVIIPTLFPYVLHKGKFSEICPNSSAPISFETDLFKGMLLVAIRTTPMNQIYRHMFEGTKTCFEVQVQGKFKKIPNGTLFIGAEITKKMNLGLLTRGLCSSILKFVKSINPLIHTSFGDSDNIELPHITGPLWSMSDRIVITPPGEEPPALGTRLPENEVRRGARRSNPFYTEEVDLNSTYSFSTNTENIELCDWAMVNVPLMKQFDLHTFWEDADIRLVAYAVPNDDSSSIGEGSKKNACVSPQRHRQDKNEYILNVELQHLSNHPSRRPNDGSNLYAPADGVRAPLIPTDSYLSFKQRTIRAGQSARFDEDSDSEDYMFYDAQEGDISADREISQSFGFNLTETIRPLSEPIDVNRWRSFLVPFVFYVDDVRRSVIGMRRELYVFCIPKRVLYPELVSSGVCVGGGDHDIHTSSLVTIRSYKEFLNTFLSVLPARESNVSQRLHRMEKRRRDLQETLRNLSLNCVANESLNFQLREFFKESIHINQLLAPKQKSGGVGNAQKRSDLGEIAMGSLVCVRSGQTIWSEEYMCLTSHELIFVKPASSLLGTNNRLVLQLTDIRSIKILDSNNWLFPIDKYYFFDVITLTRVYSVLVRGADVLSEWTTAISSALERLRALGADEKQSLVNSDYNLQKWASFQNLEHFTLPMDWRLGDHVILNGRIYNGRHWIEKPFDQCFCEDFTTAPSTNIGLDHSSHLFPLMLIERSLDLIFSISGYLDREDLYGEKVILTPQMEGQWIEFLTNIAFLPCINLDDYSFSETELTCLFINLYHTMLLHSFLVAGVPSTLLKWPGFFNSCAYEAFGDIFSLSELEHCIIKAGIGRPDTMVAQAVVPQCRYDFSLPRKDFRLLWALNCGSMSLPSSVFILTPEKYDMQLDVNLRDSLNLQFKVAKEGSFFQLVLPIVCQWYGSFLEEAAGSRFKGSLAILEILQPFVNDRDGDSLRKLLSDSKLSYTITYQSLDYRCKIFRKRHLSK